LKAIIVLISLCIAIQAQIYYWKDFKTVSGSMLGFKDRYPLVPQDQSGVKCFVKGPGTKFYGGTQAAQDRSAWLFEGDVDKRDVYRVVCLKDIIPGQSIVTSLKRDEKSGMIYGSTRNLRKGNWLPEFDYQEIRTDYERDANSKDIRPAPGHVFHFKSLDKITDLGVVQDGEGVYGIVFHAATGCLFGVTDHWKVFKFDLKARKTTILLDLLPGDPLHGRSKFRFFGKQLITDRQGNIWGTGKNGQFFTVDLKKDTVEYHDIWLPVLRGREEINGVQTWIHGNNGEIYGGTSADGILFLFDPANKKCTNIGKPNYSIGIPGLAMNSSGILYIAAGNKDTKSHFMAYDTEKHAYIDFGVIHGRVTKCNYTWRPFHIQPLLVHGKDILILGDNDRCGHVFFYNTTKELPEQPRPPEKK
jgi:hypothetical protein